MTDLRQALHTFLQSKTDFTVINAMKQFTEPDEYVSYYVLDDNTESLTQGDREFSEANDNWNVSHAPITIASLQIDVRGENSFLESRALYFGFQKWQDDLKALGLYYRGVGSISPIPKVQNGYVKEGYQFDIYLSYDSSIVTTVDYALALNLIEG
jgi:hypothetical protein